MRPPPPIEIGWREEQTGFSRVITIRLPHSLLLDAPKMLTVKEAMEVGGELQRVIYRALGYEE